MTPSALLLFSLLVLGLEGGGCVTIWVGTPRRCGVQLSGTDAVVVLKQNSQEIAYWNSVLPCPGSPGNSIALLLSDGSGSIVSLDSKDDR